MQSTVVDKSFAADAAATELLDGSPVPDDDPRLDQRSARLMRDLVMAPAQRGARGAARRAREATRSGLAWALSQFFVVGLLGLLLFVGLLILRLKLGWSVDGLLDRVLGLLPEAMRPA